MRKILLLTLLLPLAATTFAQRGDTLYCSQAHQFRLQSAIAPTSLIATGAVITAVPYLDLHINKPIQQWSQLDGHPRNEIENYFQYVPLATTPLLKLCGVESQHNWRELASLSGGTLVLSFAFSQGIKALAHEERPCSGVYNSFPSGHTITAFMGAEILRREYGKEYPGIAIAGYAVATGVGCMRVYNNRHWVGDVVAGAGFGILSASLMYWLAPYLSF